MALNLKCTACGADNTQRLNLLRGQQSFTGAVAGQTTLAATLKQPKKPWAHLVGFVLAIGAFAFSTALFPKGLEGATGLVFLLTWWGSAKWLLLGYQRELSEWETYLERNFICLRCGNIFPLSPLDLNTQTHIDERAEAIERLSNRWLGYMAVGAILLIIVVFASWPKSPDETGSLTSAPSVSKGTSTQNSPGSTAYQVDFKKPLKGSNDPGGLDLVYKKAAPPLEVESALRLELQKVIQQYGSYGDILATAWLTAGSKSGTETMMPLKDGSKHLLYSKANQKVMTWKEYVEESTPASDPSKSLKVTIAVKVVGKEGRAIVLGSTNLPDGMQLTIGLANKAKKYYAQSKVIVQTGSFSSEWFTNKGTSLPSATYTVDISSPLAELQPKKVQEVIGSKGEHLLGPWTSTSELSPGRFVKFSKEYPVHF